MSSGTLGILMFRVELVVSEWDVDGDAEGEGVMQVKYQIILGNHMQTAIRTFV